MSPEKMARQDLQKVAACSKLLEEAKRDRNKAILQAWLSGETYRDIASSARLSPSRVAQIIKEARLSA